MRNLLIALLLAGLAAFGGVFWWVSQQPLDGGKGSGAQGAQVWASEHILTGATPDPGNLNPFTTNDQVAWRYVLAWTHAPLLERDGRTGALQAGLATGVEQDGLELVFPLRSDRVFPSGNPVSPASVLFTWQVASRLQGKLGTMGVGLDLVADARLQMVTVGGAQAPGSQWNLVVTLKEPVADAAAKVATHWLVVEQESFLAALPEVPGNGQDEEALLAARVLAMDMPGVGAGPYRLAQSPAGGPWWRRDRDLRLERWFPAGSGGFAGGDPDRWNFKGVWLRFDLGEVQTMDLLRRGELDWYAAPNLGALLEREEAIAAGYRKVAFDSPQLGTHGVVWNTQRSAVSDPRVRRALGMLFDRSGVVAGLMDGVGSPAATPFKPGHPAHVEALQPLPFDPAAARQLLVEAGVELPLKVTVAAPVELPLFRQVLDLAADAGRKAGVDLVVDVRPYAAALELHGKGECDGVMVYLAGPVDVPEGWFHSREVDGRNMSRIADPELDRLLVQCMGIMDPTAEPGPFQALGRRIEALQPVAFLFHLAGEALIHNRIQGVAPGPFGLDRSRWYAVKQGR